MRTAAQPVHREHLSQYTSIPAPVGGLNLRDSIAAMPITDAIRAINWWGTTADVRVRKGLSDHVTGIGQQVESLMPYSKPDGTETLFCSANDSFYNVTSAGAVGAAVQGSLTNARWQSVNYTNTSGTSFLCCFNGADSPRYWDNSSWTTITGASSPAITGLTTSNIINVSMHKKRMWLTEKDTLYAWFLPVDAVGGAAQKLDLSAQVKDGGYLMATASWTRDGGDGLDDFWVAVTSEGEVVIYQGNDPTSGSTWGIVGTWKVGRPIGRRCFLQYGSDLLLLCEDGIFPFSALGRAIDEGTYITHKIRQGIRDGSEDNFSNFGWEMLFVPKANMLLLNIPESEGSIQYQYAMNTITGSWWEFNDISANCWTMFKGDPYFGTNGEVVKFWTGTADNSADIEADLRTAVNYFDDRGRLKEWTAMKMTIETSGNPDVFIDINTDFDNVAATIPIDVTETGGAAWDTAEWDVALWGGINVYDEWNTVHGVGNACSTRVKTTSNDAEVRLLAFDYLYQSGGVIA